MLRPIGFWLSTLVLGASGYAGARALGPVPALGPLLDPANGIWGVAGTAELPSREAVTLPGLDGAVRVVYDDRRVPHIYASSVLDAYRAQGWVVARDRLFQLEIQTRATAGTLTELVGDAALDTDRRARALGLAWAAERDWAALQAHPDVTSPVEAYASGVSAYIAALEPGDRPFEYHLLGAEPTAWHAVHSLYLLKRMGWMLAYSATESTRQAAASRVGREAASALFPDDAPIQEPIVPHRGRRYHAAEIPPPGTPEVELPYQLQALEAMPGSLDRFAVGDGAVLGSNNWVVGPSRSATGRPILAGDPHLGLTLPSIWYEVHLVVPGQLDVYGVALIGAPGVTIGFNRDVAWSFTNAGTDVVDFYRERFDDAAAPRRYLVDGEWRDLEVRIEEYRDRDGRLLHTDTILHTHRGPVRRSDGSPMSMRWAVLDGQGEIETLSRIGRARSVEEWLAAMESWRAPIQNGLVADRSGHIAIRAQGFYPERPENTTGAWFYDGTTSAADWTGRLPSVPTAVDPEQGFLASANQQPVDPEVDDTFLGADWPTPWRALTINRLLRSKQRHTADDLASYHTYPSSARAEHFVPAFLAAAEAVRSAGDGGGALSEAVALLVSWDLRYDRDNTGPVLFERAMTEVTGRVYDELEDAEGRRVATPSDAITWVLLGQPRSPWWDDRSTEPVETRDAILAESLAASYRDLREALGPVGPAWRWREHRTARIRHLLGIPALSRTDLAIQGGPGLLNPSAGSGAFGASWRMVVELGDEVRARGTYPGGQSGNPLSTGYADRLEIWVEGDLSDLRFPAPEGSLDSAGLTRSRLTLSPGGRP